MSCATLYVIQYMCTLLYIYLGIKVILGGIAKKHVATIKKEKDALVASIHTEVM